MKIVTLVDNHAVDGIGCASEHGFSAYIEYGNRKILFDTGCGELVLRNARALGVDLSLIDTLIISHGHYDHGGGVLSLLETFSYPSLSLYTGEGIFKRKFVKEEEGEKELGPGFDSRSLADHGLIHHEVARSLSIGEGIHLISHFSGADNADLNPRFLIDEEAGEQIDPFNDEISLLLESPEGAIFIVGCSHPGIMRMVERVKREFGFPIRVLIGGIHLYDATDEKRSRVLDQLIAEDIGQLALSHCTGDEAAHYLEEHTSNYLFNAAGTVLEF